MDILLDENNDCVFINGPLTSAGVTKPLTQTVAQRLKILLQTFAGEWFWDTSYGVDYWGKILGKKTSKVRVDLLLQQAILSEPGVREIVTFDSTFNNRVYSLTFSVRVTDGTITAPITITPIS